MAEFLAKTEQKSAKMCKTLLNRCYLLFEEYLHEKTFFLYPKIMPKNRPMFTVKS